MSLPQGRSFRWRQRHALVKGAVYIALYDAARASGLVCQVYPDGMAIEIDAHTVYEPDAAVRMGSPIAGNALKYSDPIIVVEVISPSSEGLHTGGKLTGYFALPSLQHYLIVDPGKRQVIHHERAGVDIHTRLMTDGILALEPPGLQLEVARLFG